MFYGLDWIATVPPTVKLTADRFGRERAGIVFGWIFAGHQIGAATAAFGAGLFAHRILDLPAGVLCRRRALSVRFGFGADDRQAEARGHRGARSGRGALKTRSYGVHGRACPGHPRLSCFDAFKIGMPQASAGMTQRKASSLSAAHQSR